MEDAKWIHGGSSFLICKSESRTNGGGSLHDPAATQPHLKSSLPHHPPRAPRLASFPQRHFGHCREYSLEELRLQAGRTFGSELRGIKGGHAPQSLVEMHRQLSETGGWAVVSYQRISITGVSPDRITLPRHDS